MTTENSASGEARTVPQGDLALLESDVALRLLTSRIPARLAYTWTDGTTRVVPIWFHWTGEEFVMATHVPSPKIRALRANPTVAITIDSEGFPPDVLQVRGRASVTEVRGAAPEYRLAARRYLGDEAGTAYADQVDESGAMMARISVRPTWTGTLDFQTRFPSALPEKLR